MLALSLKHHYVGSKQRFILVYFKQTKKRCLSVFTDFVAYKSDYELIHLVEENLHLKGNSGLGVG